MICSNCGFQNEPGDEFCGSCGQFLAWEGEQATPTSEQPPSGGEPIPASQQPVDGAAGTTSPPAAGAPTTGAGAPTTGTGAQATASDEQVPPPTIQEAPTGTTPVQQTWSAGAGTAGPAGTESSGGGGPALGTTPGLVRCTVCGTANEPTRIFCSKCGTRLKAGGRGQRTRARALPYVGAGVVLIVIIALLGTGFVLLSGGPAATTSPSPSTPAGLVASSGSQATRAPGATASEPVVTGNTETSSPESAAPTAAPGTITPTSGFSCADQQLAATASGRWILESARWGHKGAADFLALALAPGADSTDIASVAATLVPPGQVSSRFGVTPPTGGDITLVLTFNDVVGFSGAFNAQVGYRVLDAFNVAKGDQKLIYVVLGVTGSGCYNLSSEGWASGSRSSTELMVQIHK